MSQIDDATFNPNPTSFPHMNTVEEEEDNKSNRDFAPPPQHRQQEYPHYLNPEQIYQFQDNNKKDIFKELDKTVYIIIFIAFILGFFMGKTMQPVILRPL
jgi:hypothetical protein